MRVQRQRKGIPYLSSRETAATYKRCLLALMEDGRLDLCGVVCASSWHEPVACALPPDHEGDHSWASIPQFDHRVTADNTEERA